jgi:hypothetical protein
MPVPLPNLDDRSYEQLRSEALALLPSLQPEWTNHNPSDPGITLIELFAWLTEMLLFRVNQIPSANVERFLRLLNGSDWTLPGGASVDQAARDTVVWLRSRDRAVTAEDYEAMTLRADARVRRARCIPRRNLAAGDLEEQRAIAPAHVSVVVLLDAAADQGDVRDEILTGLWSVLDDRRMLTTRHHVVGPQYVDVEVAANLALRPDALPDDALRAAHAAVAAFLDPLVGGRDGTGWPFGRDLHGGDVCAVLDAVDLVDFVEDVTINGGDLVELDDHQLVALSSTAFTAFDVHGGRRTRRAKR